MTGRNMFYVSFILLLELKNHLLNLNMNRSETAMRKGILNCTTLIKAQPTLMNKNNTDQVVCFQILFCVGDFISNWCNESHQVVFPEILKWV